MSASGLRAGLAVLAMAAMLALAGCAHLVILRDPLSANEHNDLGVAYESGGHAALAMKEYRSSLRLDARQGRTWVNLGNVQAAQGRWRHAESSYRHALRVAPDDPDAMNNLAAALLAQGRHPDEARALAVRAVAAGGEHDSIYRSTAAEAHGDTL